MKQILDLVARFRDEMSSQMDLSYDPETDANAVALIEEATEALGKSKWKRGLPHQCGEYLFCSQPKHRQEEPHITPGRSFITSNGERVWMTDDFLYPRMLKNYWIWHMPFTFPTPPDPPEED